MLSYIPTNSYNSQPKNQPKVQPKSAAADKKKATANKAGAAKGAAPKKQRGGRNARPAKKTAAELDSEMADYFVGSANAENAAPAPAANNGEAMEEIM